MKTKISTNKVIFTVLALGLILTGMHLRVPFNADASLVAGWVAIWSAAIAWAGTQLFNTSEAPEPFMPIALFTITFFLCGALAGYLAVFLSMLGGVVLGFLFKLSNRPSATSDFQ